MKNLHGFREAAFLVGNDMQVWKVGLRRLRLFGPFNGDGRHFHVLRFEFLPAPFELT